MNFKWYFTPCTFEMKGNGRIYKKIGIKTWQKIVLATAGRIHSMYIQCYGKIPISSYFIGDYISSSALIRYENLSRITESIHVFIILMLVMTIPFEITIAAFIYILFNLYLVFLQRYNRIRIYTIRKKRYKFHTHPQ